MSSRNLHRAFSDDPLLFHEDDSDYILFPEEGNAISLPSRKMLPMLHREISIEYETASVMASDHIPRAARSISRGSNSSTPSYDSSTLYSRSETLHEGHDDTGIFTAVNAESVGDSEDEDELESTVECLTVRDTYRECLEKDPNDRTEEEIETLLEFMQHLPAFANMTLSVRRELCAVMVFAVVERAGTVVMNDGEELDSWSVIVNGMVQVELPDGSLQDLYLGDSFGITPTMEKMHHTGIMRTKMDDCQFVCIAQSEYYRILHQGEENTRKLEENGRVILVTEQRIVDGGTRSGHVVIRGTPEQLLTQLLDDNNLDGSYIEDFLLTHRVFFRSSHEIIQQMLHWFRNEKYTDRVIRVVLLWVNNHFTDFETDTDMIEFLEEFDEALSSRKKFAQLRLLNIACTTKARLRNITLARSNRDEPLQFAIVGGYENGTEIFVSDVFKGSKASESGLRRGDQLLEVNGQNFNNMYHSKALELIQRSTHLQISARSNLMGLKETLKNAGRGRIRQHRKSLATDHPLSGCEGLAKNGETRSNDLVFAKNEALFDLADEKIDARSALIEKSEVTKKGFMTLGNRTKLRKALAKIIPKNVSLDVIHPHQSTDDPRGTGSLRESTMPHRYHSHSNPDLSSPLLCYESSEQGTRTDFSEYVLKVYRADQTSKFLIVHRETTAREVVMLSLRGFGITDSSSFYSLCEVTVGEGGLVKQRRLPDQLQNLAGRMELRSRYYLKNNNTQETLLPDVLAEELLRESFVSFLQLNSAEVATQLTLEDFNIFRQIEPTEYIDDLFEILNSHYGSPMLSKFAELVNREMFWVVTQVVSETTLVRRMRTVKQFIKIARYLREYRNFNSMFAILSGLGHGAVTRLKSTWERLPSKYIKLFQDLQELMDPSRNMCRYRTLISRLHAPLIPFYPVVRKDLSFIHFGNDTLVDGLVNFEKLRMVSKEVRLLMAMCSQPYSLSNQDFVSSSRSESSASLALSMGATLQSTMDLSRHKSARKKSTTYLNQKKMFEEAQMVRRVRAYFSILEVITDEDKLHDMSQKCEAITSQSNSGTPQSSNSPRDNSSHTSTIRKRNPSPTLSTTSSASFASTASEGKKNMGPKFGTDSPQAMKKLLALSEGVPKIRNPVKYVGQPPIPPVAGHPRGLGENPPVTAPRNGYHV